MAAQLLIRPVDPVLSSSELLACKASLGLGKEEYTLAGTLLNNNKRFLIRILMPLFGWGGGGGGGGGFLCFPNAEEAFLHQYRATVGEVFLEIFLPLH